MALPPLELLEKQISRTEQQLMMHLILEQRETNRLLAELITCKHVVDTSEVTNIDTIDGYKRQDLMKRISELPEKPQGWQKWGTEEMRKLLKEAV